MVTIDKLRRGLTRYVDTEVLPHLQGKDKWMVAGVLTMYLGKLPAIIQAAANNEAIKMLGIIAADGSVDVEYIINSIKPIARNTPASFQLPLSSSTITMREDDLDLILDYINGG
jgi:hypothetical protein